MFQKIPFILSATDVLAEVTGMDGCRIDRGILMGQTAQEAKNMSWILSLLWWR
jgi:hypothetical protein